MTSEDIRERVFETVKRRGGYSREDVDGFLDQVTEAFREKENLLSELQNENANLRVRVHDAETEIRELREVMPAQQTDAEGLRARAEQLEKENDRFREALRKAHEEAEETPCSGRQTLCDEIQVQQLVLGHLERAREEVERQAHSADSYAASVLREGSLRVDEVRSAITETLSELGTFRSELGALISEQGGQLLARIDELDEMKSLLGSLNTGSRMLTEQAAQYEGRNHSDMTGIVTACAEKPRAVRAKRSAKSTTKRTSSAAGKSARGTKTGKQATVSEAAEKQNEQADNTAQEIR